MPSDEAVTQRAGSRRAMTGLTEAALKALRPHVEPACVGSRQDRTMEGQPRTRRRYTTDDPCPLPTTADKRLVILTDVQQPPSQAVPGQLCGMSQAHAHTWMHRRHPVLNQALADHERLPARTADDLAALLTTPPTDASAPSSLLFMRGPHEPSSVRKTWKSRQRMTVGSRHATRAQTSS
jgi:hypothetical protein